ncbi:hypothetical protein Caci_2872 [Catenulispora acidiphila DSM 44928]|uniref:Uncharacterized protein n=1 Tax=Catenulispora acidiphila (strain DSM 44928 / JCM 14897 / NBRC 102108 / NRRL B-24433 / ID139908) TaxID=479433 RepID=C7Q1A6_CATAD|nr:hypothetical protein [Catenulispora acidiphila]ACU71781.1 hypothetical protein Caci_2872 [Catenulispora acidiphila DSM 44928]
MIPIILIAIAWWAGSGVVATVKAARASTPATAGGGATAGAGPKTAGARNTGKGAPSSGSSPSLGPGDITFGQWQRSLYRRWKTKTRAHLPGRRLGGKLADLFGDATAASLAGAAIFGLGFVSGATWTAKKRTARGTQNKTQRQSRTPKNGSASTAGRRWSRPGTPSGGTTGFSLRRRGAQQPNVPPHSSARPDDAVIDAELTDDIQAPVTTPSQFASSEYADIVNQPELPAHPTAIITAPNGHAMAAEILTIHDLFRWAKNAFAYAVSAVEQSTVRANSAIERAANALVRSSTAVARHETAVATANKARQHAAQLEETAARFSVLRVDNASMTSIGVGITTAVGLAQTEQRRADAEAVVAEIAASLAAAEQIAAECNQASAQAAILHAEAVKNMHDTVQRHQGPHSEAQAMTGNAAAHQTVLAIN